jgi:Tfp pilus assembly protein PilX
METRTRAKLKSGDSGVALILVLLAILVLTTLAAGMVYFARSETLASYNYRIGTQAEYVALAGVQRALNFFNGASYSPLAPASAGPAPGTYYQVSTYATSPVDLFFSNATPVGCTSGCSHSGAVTLGADAGASAYPPSSVTGGVDVVANWVAAMPSQTITDSMGGSGSYTVTARLLEYHTVNNAFFGVAAAGCSDSLAGAGICRQPYEVWEVRSVGTWNSNIGGGSQSPTVEVVATISPMFLPYFGNALYGLCNVTLSGNVGTDSYNSASGQYGGNPLSYVTPSSGTTNAQAIGAGVGSNGGVTISGSANSVGGNVTYANQSSPASCNTGFQGTATGVAGSVLPGPAIPPPPDITAQMTGWGYPTTSPSVTPAGGGGSYDHVANVYLRASGPPPLPPGVAAGSACPAGATGYIEQYNHQFKSGANSYSSYTCVALSGSGTSTDPYRLGDVTANSSNPGTINLISPSSASSNPAYVAMNSVTVGTNGVLNTSNVAPSYPPTTDNTFNANPPAPTEATASSLVIDVRNSVDMTGTANMNYNPSTPGVPAPNHLVMNVMGTGTALSLAGQSQLCGMINAPNGDASLGGSGSTGTFFGAILAKNITDKGNYPVHYDLNSRTVSGALFTARVVSVTRPKF